MNWQNIGIFFLILLIWFALNRWIMPLLGIETCMSGACAAFHNAQPAPAETGEKTTPPRAEGKKTNGPIELSEVNFHKQVLQSSEPVLVDFFATWCSPCRMLAPVVDELAKENAGSVKIGKLDIDANPHIAARYGVNSVPTVMVFKNGRIVEKLVGLHSKANFQAAIERAVN